MEDLNPYERATKLLRKYDKRKYGLMMLERELNKAAREYGQSIGCTGYSKDHLRSDMLAKERFSNLTNGGSRRTAA